MNLKPLGDRIVVKVLSREEKTKGGIVLPDTAKEKPTEGEVIAVGTGKVLDNAGTEVKLDGEDYVIFSERDVLAIVDKK